MRNISSYIFIVLLLVSLLGCGRVAEEPTTPIAKVAGGQEVFISLQCQLDGSLSSGNLANYVWNAKTVPSGAATPSITSSHSGKAYFTPTSLGTYEFELELSNSLGVSTDAIAITVVSFSPPSIEAGFYGVCSHLQSHDGETMDNIVTQARMMSQAGIQIVRFDFDWKDVEPSDDNFVFTKYDAIINKLKAKGIKALGILDYGNTWSDPTTGNTEEINRFADFTYNTVKHFKDDVKFWQIWNEPNNEVYWPAPSAANYTKLMKAAYGAAKQADPEAVVVQGGLVGNGKDEVILYDMTFAAPDYLKGIYENGGKDYFDVMSIHPYNFAKDIASTASIETAIDDAKAVMASYGDSGKPFWLTELGPLFFPPTPMILLFVDRGYTEAEKASWLSLIYINLKNKCDKLFWFEFRDNPGPITIQNQNWEGLSSSDYTIKEPYAAYKNLIK
jgi:hypothetical protein